MPSMHSAALRRTEGWKAPDTWSSSACCKDSSGTSGKGLRFSCSWEQQALRSLHLAQTITSVQQHRRLDETKTDNDFPQEASSPALGRRRRRRSRRPGRRPRPPSALAACCQVRPCSGCPAARRRKADSSTRRQKPADDQERGRRGCACSMRAQSCCLRHTVRAAACSRC